MAGLHFGSEIGFRTTPPWALSQKSSVKPFTVIEILRPARQAGFEPKRKSPPEIAADLVCPFSDGGL
jgi:hypothetical protein